MADWVKDKTSLWTRCGTRHRPAPLRFAVRGRKVRGHRRPTSTEDDARPNLRGEAGITNAQA